MLAGKRKMGGHTTNDIYDSAAKARVGLGKKHKMDGPTKCNECKDEEKGEQRGGGRKCDCVD